MGDDNNITVQEGTPEDNTSLPEQDKTSPDSFSEGWDDVGSPSEESEPSAAEETPPDDKTSHPDGTDDQAAEKAPADAGNTAQTKGAENPPAAAPRTWDIQYMGQQRRVTEAEVPALLQKGFDYERIRPMYDEAKPVMAMFSEFAKQANMSVADYVTFVRQQTLQAQGLSEADAKRTIELDKREARVAEREAQDQRIAAAVQSEDARRKADIAQFRKIYPEAAKDYEKSIPAEVWEKVNQGESLVVAFGQYRESQLTSALQAAQQKAAMAEQNGKNAARSTGSQQSAGDGKTGRDPFLDGWNE